MERYRSIQLTYFIDKNLRELFINMHLRYLNGIKMLYEEIDIEQVTNGDVITSINSRGRNSMCNCRDTGGDHKASGIYIRLICSDNCIE